MKSLWVLPALALALATAAAAEEPVLPEGDDAEYAYGTVARVQPDALLVREYDFETGTTVEVAYRLDAQVILNGVNAVQQIAVDDDVDIDYVTKDGHRLATVISVEKPAAQPEPDGPNPEELL